MFSGIVESVQPIIAVKAEQAVVRIQVQKPQEFNDLKIGDSVAIDGVCLTVEKFDAEQITFALAHETLQVLDWKIQPIESLIGKTVNLERSLRFGDRIHGHLVTGHVDSVGIVTRSEALGENWFLDVKINNSVLPYVWNKGSITLNGVALTVNSVEQDVIQVCLIPETVKRTNLATLSKQDPINVEPDYMARALYRGFETGKISKPSEFQS